MSDDTRYEKMTAQGGEKFGQRRVRTATRKEPVEVRGQRLAQSGGIPSKPKAPADPKPQSSGKK